MSYNKYYLYKKQVSYDRGTTWEDVTPLETVPSGDSIGTYDTLEECESGYTPSPSYSGQYFTFEALEDGTFSFISFSNDNISYSIDSGNTWNTLASNTNSPTVTAGNKIMWKSTLASVSSSGIGRFTSTGRFNVEGNTMSLLYEDNFENQISLSGKTKVFEYLFSTCTGITSAENLVLPSTTLTTDCYHGMFWDCTNLTTAPVLSATTLGSRCYGRMFMGCTSLTTAPDLPAITLVSDCYEYMFYGCTSLNYIKCLATNVSGASATEHTENWLYNVSSTGTFVKNASIPKLNWPSGASGRPIDWTVQNA